jgi:hypothetical protein
MTTTLTRDHTPIEACESETDRTLNGVFTTALEGGIGYWSTCSRYRWSLGDVAHTEARDFIAVIEESDSETEFVIDRSAIIRGIRKAYAYYRGSEGQPYITRALTDLTFGKYDDLDYDATVADVIVQFGVLGELVYG